jgi:adenylosuccinate lyase
MPHKRNPERSEHLDTLARLVRSSAGVLLEAMVQAHERDGRGWKAEWIALPEVCLLTGAGLRLTIDIVSGLEVDRDRMAHNLLTQSDVIGSEQVLAALSSRLGKHEAQALLQQALSPDGPPPSAEVEKLMAAAAADLGPAVTSAVAMADLVGQRARWARSTETDVWA